jgi:hypothetical protein
MSKSERSMTFDKKRRDKGPAGLRIRSITCSIRWLQRLKDKRKESVCLCQKNLSVELKALPNILTGFSLVTSGHPAVARLLV